MTDREERTAFSVLVLGGIWMLARLILTRDVWEARVWRGQAIGHMDVIGQQTAEARAYRREVTFPDLRG